ncbi:SAM-dependent methyltransferase [Shewanella submarina]|uniref:SAM-dependent methyltransferase n=1 Tax=Shewanella submarina TaxID=2016376 RepID=A0ABV7GDS2_9GAMM|nr:SAM-dependent methyltransferase [Shewanella submarina]MCL1036977.1 SAM-dependent methyltransferase [Shewanella submarina]
MTVSLQCPICRQPLSQYLTSKDLHCSNKHQFPFTQVHEERGYWVFGKGKKQQVLSRAQMRSRLFLLSGGLQAPLIDAMTVQLIPLLSGQSTLSWLDYESAEGFYLRALAESLAQQQAELTLERYGFAEADNALFAAAKAGSDEVYAQCSSKGLPYVDNSFDLLTVIDKPLKGKEAVRVLKEGGLALIVIPASRHLWQLRTQVFADLAEKEVSINLPKELELVVSTRIQWNADVDGEQALTLLDMTPYAWRANDKLKSKIARESINGLEMDYLVVLARKSRGE